MNPVDTYIEQFPHEVKLKLLQLRKIIKETVPLAEEKIAWGAPTYYLNGYLIQFAGYKSHIGFYTTPSTLTYFQEELKEFKTNGKNTMQILVHQDIPVDLIRRMIAYRVQENQ